MADTDRDEEPVGYCQACNCVCPCLCGCPSCGCWPEDEEPSSSDRSAIRRCRHCFEPIESFNGYDYASRGPSWRHEKTREVYCRTTTAEPVPLACPLCRRYEPEHETPEELMDLPLATDQIPASVETIRDRLDFIERDAQDIASRYEVCREAARRLARACYAAPLTDPEVTRAYDEFMALDSANFAVATDA